jgi:hypothetical protein
MQSRDIKYNGKQVGTGSGDGRDSGCSLVRPLSHSTVISTLPAFATNGKPTDEQPKGSQPPGQLGLVDQLRDQRATWQQKRTLGSFLVRAATGMRYCVFRGGEQQAAAS